MNRDACRSDLTRSCPAAVANQARILACLDRHAGDLSPDCRAAAGPPPARKTRRVRLTDAAPSSLT